MAATRLIAMHINKGQSASKSLKGRTDYAKNGEKTEKGELVTAYECNAEIADKEFLTSRSEYLKNHRGHANDILAYQIRQSFKPGEITPEEANRIGYETAMRFTKGNHAFIVATHVDKAHIHNHVIFNAVNLDGSKKFRDFFFSAIALQRLSDIICLENGLSVIKPRKPSERIKRTTYPKRTSYREIIKQTIDDIIDKSPKDFEEFLRMLREEDYEIKRGKEAAIRGKNQKRFIRFSSLGEGYSQDDIELKIRGEYAAPSEKSEVNRDGKSERDFDLLIDVQELIAKGKGDGYINFAKKFNAKQVAKALLFLENHEIRSLEELRKKTDEASGSFHDLNSTIKNAEKRLAEIAVLKTHIFNYAKTRDVYIAYRKSGYSRAFYEAHREEILLHKAAKDAFDRMPAEEKRNGKIPSIRELNEEYAVLLQQKKEAYSEYRQAKQEMQDYMIARQDIERILGLDQQEQKKQKKRENSL